MRGLIRLLSVVSLLFATLIMVMLTVGTARWMWMLRGSTRFSAEKVVSVIPLTGVIWNSSPFVRAIQEAAKDEAVRAIVVRIQSPGGMVAPSQEIYDAILAADQKKPVVVSMAAVAASGGYYAALGGRTIFANPGTLTASIGVIMEFLNMEKLYQWAKVERFAITAGTMKDAGSPLKRMTPEEKKHFQALLDNVHQQFRATVAERRKIESPDLEAVTDGRVMTGSQALEAKLIDRLGGLTEALAEARSLAGLSPDAKVIYPQKDHGMLMELLFGDEMEDQESETRLDLLGALAGAWRPFSAGVSLTGWHVLMLSAVQ